MKYHFKEDDQDTLENTKKEHDQDKKHTRKRDYM